MLTEPTPTATAKQIQRDGRIATRVFGLLCRFDLPAEVRVAADRPTIIAGNHRSLLDVFCAAATCAKAGVSCRFLVQASYFSNGVIGWWLRRIGCIPLNRDTRDEAFAEACRSLANGEVIGIMPEGRLIAPEDWDPHTGRARPGVSELAAMSNARVAPIAFHNTEKVWPRNGWPKLHRRRPTVTLEIGEPIDLEGDDHQANADQIMGEVNRILERIDSQSR